MTKQPGTPKPKSAAPAQFDMNSRERKGGPGGPGRRGRDTKRPPSRIETLPPSLIDRGEGWTIWKIGKIDQDSHAAVGAAYQLIFEGHEPLMFDYLGAARDRSKEPAPEKLPVEEVATAVSEEVAVSEELAAEETPTDDPSIT